MARRSRKARKTMSAMMELWNAWAYMFRSLPYGDPYIAAIALVFTAIFALKVLRNVFHFVNYTHGTHRPVRF